MELSLEENITILRGWFGVWELLNVQMIARLWFYTFVEADSLVILG